MARMYLRNTTANTAGYSTAEKSTLLPVGSGVNTAAPILRDLLNTKGTTQTSVALASLAQTTRQDICHGRWFSPLLVSTSLGAVTIPCGFAYGTSNTASTQQIRFSIYVLTNADTVRGFIWDGATSSTSIVSTSEYWQLSSISGSAVASIASTDRLVVEAWTAATQSMGTSYTDTFYYDGTYDDPTNTGAVGTGVTATAASFFDFPDWWGAPPASDPPKIPHRFRNGLVMRGRR